MKYLLFVSFCYKHYKKENYFRLYLDGSMIDEVPLTEDINRVGIDFVTSTLSQDSWLRRDLVRKQKLSNGKMPLLTDKIWLYVVDIKDGHTPKIKVDFSITDNNYTNGFMTKGSMARLEKVGLIPMESFNRLQKGFWHEYWGYYKAKRLRFTETFGHSGRGFKYPTVDMFKVSIKNQVTKLEPFDLHSLTMAESDQWIGEDFSVTIDTLIKHKTLMLKGHTHDPIGIISIDPVFLLMAKHKDVINIYNENN